MTIFYSVNPTDSRIFCTNARFINCSLLSVLVSCNNYHEYTELNKITFIKNTCLHKCSQIYYFGIQRSAEIVNGIYNGIIFCHQVK